MELNKNLNFNLKDFILFGQLGNIKLGEDRSEIEKCLGKGLLEDFPKGERSVRYTDLGLSFDYYKNTDKVFNISIATDILRNKKNKTEEKLNRVFLDYTFFYSPAKEIFKLILENNVKLFFISNLSGDGSPFYFVTSNNVKLLFAPALSGVYSNAQLSSIGSDFGCIQQTIQNNATEITVNNFIVPPMFNEMRFYPHGKKLDFFKMGYTPK